MTTARWPSGALLLAPCALVCALLPVPTMGVQLALCVPAIAIFGLPHGATDWKLAGLLWRPRFGCLWPVVFAALYLALMLLVAAAAALAPRIALLGFLVVSVWHFGAEDAAALGVARRQEEGFASFATKVTAPVPLYSSLVRHGLAPPTGSGEGRLFEKRSKNFCVSGNRVGATLALYGQEFFGSFLQQRTARLSPLATAILACGIPPIAGSAVFWPHQYAAVLALLGVHLPGGDGVLRATALALIAASAILVLYQNNARAAMEFAAGLALQAAAPPLIAFTLYFCLLHAPRHMAALPHAATGWQAAPISLAAVAIIAAGVCASLGGPPATTLGSPPAAGFSAWLNAAAATGLLWGLACLTLPHVVLGHLARRLHAAPQDFSDRTLIHG